MKSMRHKLLGKVNILAAKIGLDKDELYDYIEQWTGLKSTYDAKGRHLLGRLDVPHLLLVVNNLETAQLGVSGNVVETDANTGRPIHKVQKKQIARIAAIGYKLAWSSLDIRNFISRQTKGRVRDWNDLTLTEASHVIVGMENIKRERAR